MSNHDCTPNGYTPHQNFEFLKRLILENVDGTKSYSRHAYLSMVDKIKADQPVTTPKGETIYLGLERAPAAKRNHHAYEGGLVAHMLEMWNIWTTLRGSFQILDPSHITNDRVMRGILNHDIHKAVKTFVLVNEDPWQTDYYDEQDQGMLTDDIKSLQILTQNLVYLDTIQMNTLLWSHGGFSTNPPKQCCALAKLCYLLDELSGNVIEKVRTGAVMGYYSLPTKR